ncbi:hypothetical protein TWF718_004262 [Orbilia javanica]|uniref:Uncharacterized protein n=1 Tax=Orbilia javanica TaxID=47235 RepID=A0AAN8MXK3_9PEZI
MQLAQTWGSTYAMKPHDVMVADITRRIEALWMVGKLPPPRTNSDYDRKYYIHDIIARIFELHRVWGGDTPPSKFSPLAPPQPVVPLFPPAPSVRRPILPLSDLQLSKLAAGLTLSDLEFPEGEEEECIRELRDDLSKLGLNPDDILRK